MDVVSARDPGVIERAVAALRAGQVIAIPTETVYGLAVLPQERFVDRLIEVKRRSVDKGIQLMIDSLDQARQVAALSPAAERMAAAFWPGGLTIVVERLPQAGLPLVLGGGRMTLGLRLPDHAVPREIARRVGPIAASSANLSGEPAATTAERVAVTLADVVGLLVDDGPVRGGVSSTVVDCTAPDGSVRVLREGAIAADDVLRIAG